MNSAPMNASEGQRYGGKNRLGSRPRPPRSSEAGSAARAGIRLADLLMSARSGRAQGQLDLAYDAKEVQDLQRAATYRQRRTRALQAGRRDPSL